MNIITISRQFGSGGRELGRHLAKALGYDYYDKEIITALSSETNLNEKFIENALDNVLPSFTLTFGKTFLLTPINTTVKGTGATKLLVKEANIIKDIAKKGRNCVIVGRNADLLLKEFNPLNLFIYATMDAKIKRCLNYKGEEKLTVKELEKKIIQIDKNRAKHRQLMSDNGKWGNMEDYNLCVNTSGLIIKDLIPVLEKYVEFYFSKK